MNASGSQDIAHPLIRAHCQLVCVRCSDKKTTAIALRACNRNASPSYARSLAAFFEEGLRPNGEVMESAGAPHWSITPHSCFLLTLSARCSQEELPAGLLLRECVCINTTTSRANNRWNRDQRRCDKCFERSCQHQETCGNLDTPGDSAAIIISTSEAIIFAAFVFDEEFFLRHNVCHYAYSIIAAACPWLPRGLSLPFSASIT
jgi:hypothetical protein